MERNMTPTPIAQATAPADLELKSRMQRLEELLAKVDKITDPAARDMMSEIIQTLMDFHGAAVSKMLEQIAANGKTGPQAIEQMAQDELIGSLFLLYGLHPSDLKQRVQAALQQVRPYLASHGGNVQLLDISEDAAVHLQLQGSCHGCPSSMQTLKNSIEQAIYDKAPDVTAIHVSGLEEKPPATHSDGFVPLERLTVSKTQHSLQGMGHAK